MRRLVCGAPLLALVLGCAGPPIAKFTLLTTDPEAVHPILLASDVSATHCLNLDILGILFTPPWRPDPLVNHSLAIAEAIGSVPSANVMTRISVEVRETFYLVMTRSCVEVRGDVGRLE